MRAADSGPSLYRTFYLFIWFRKVRERTNAIIVDLIYKYTYIYYKYLWSKTYAHTYWVFSSDPVRRSDAKNSAAGVRTVAADVQYYFI